MSGFLVAAISRIASMPKMTREISLVNQVGASVARRARSSENKSTYCGVKRIIMAVMNAGTKARDVKGPTEPVP